MRLILIAGVVLALAGAAEAQTDPYGRPKALNPLPPLGSTQPVPGMPTPAPFTPYRPPSYMRTPPASEAEPNPHMRHTPGVMPAPPAATADDPYPSLHPRRKHQPF